MRFPFSGRATPPGTWNRFLVVALPALFLTGLMAMTLSRASETMQNVRKLADLCESDDRLVTPLGQLERVTEMHRYIEALYEKEMQQLGGTQ